MYYLNHTIVFIQYQNPFHTYVLIPEGSLMYPVSRNSLYPTACFFAINEGKFQETYM
jgi:hypothetical protein